MLRKRIIPCLDVKDGRTVKGVNFEDIRDAGDPVELAELYAREGGDELVFLDITATHEGRKTLVKMVEEVARVTNIPFTVGGGVSSVEDGEAILRAGADKIAVNSAAIKDPSLLGRLADRFGSQSIVLAIDARWDGEQWTVHRSGGQTPTERELFEWAQEGVEEGAGEILFTSMDHDGTRKGFALDALARLNDELPCPLIASGGGGSIAHFEELFQKTGVDAALAASIFHFQEVPIPELKKELEQCKIPVRN